MTNWPVTLFCPNHRTKEKASLKQTLAASHRAYLSNRSQLEQEVSHLKKEVECLELKLANTQKVLKYLASK